jgi:actin-related protein 5
LGDLSQDCKRSLSIFTDLFLITNRQNAAAVSSDEEEDLNQLQAVEQKLLNYDPTFTNEHTHASITSRRSALISAFRPLYKEGDIEGIFSQLA